VTERLAAWRARWLTVWAPHERALLAGVLAAAALGGLVAAALAIRADLARLEAAVAAGEQEVAALRRLAADLGPTPAATPAGGPSLVTRLETAAAAVVGRPRIAAMTPATTPLPEGLREERVTLRLAGTSLAELVRLLHGLGTADPPIDIAGLKLRKHPDDPRRFDASVEAARVVPAGEP
jgi:hypothetical protein